MNAIHVACWLVGGVLTACAGADPTIAPDDGSTSAASEDTPVERIYHGIRLRRGDTVSPEELDALQHPVTTGLSQRERLALELRPAVLYQGVPYLAVEPVYGLADDVIAAEEAGPPPTVPGAAQREGRTILGNGPWTADGRNQRVVGDSAPFAQIGFSTIGGTISLIGRRTALTAAHVVYETRDAKTQGWYCRNGTTSGGIGTACPGDSYPRFAFGVDGTTHVLPANGGWIDFPCATVAFNAAFAGLPGVQEPLDYAVIDFTPCSNDLGLGYLSNTPSYDFAANPLSLVNNWGFPSYAKCPQGAFGASTAPGDCVGGTRRVLPNVPPYTSARLWGGFSHFASFEGSDTLKSEIDATPGHSGGPLLLHIGASLSVVGITSTGGTPWNKFNRWTTARSTWVAGVSAYPEDL